MPLYRVRITVRNYGNTEDTEKAETPIHAESAYDALQRVLAMFTDETE